MLKKMQKTLFTEKIPAILCAAACLASVFMGFALGYAFLGLREPVLAYGDTTAVYQADTPPLAVVCVLDDQITQSPAQSSDEFAENGQEATHLYVVTILGGYIAIYHAEENGGGLKEVTTTAVGTLAPEELERLEAGIKIYSDKALALILQDYGS